MLTATGSWASTIFHRSLRCLPPEVFRKKRISMAMALWASRMSHHLLRSSLSSRPTGAWPASVATVARRWIEASLSLPAGVEPQRLLSRRSGHVGCDDGAGLGAGKAGNQNRLVLTCVLSNVQLANSFSNQRACHRDHSFHRFRHHVK